MTFVALVLIEFFKAYSYRSDRRSVLDRPFANRWLNLAIAWELGCCSSCVHVPFPPRAAAAPPLPPRGWGLVVCAALPIVPVLESAQRLLARR